METTMTKQEGVMTMMQSQLETLEAELYEAYASLGKAAVERSRGNEIDSSIYYRHQDFCSICEEKVNLMRKLINNASVISEKTPALTA